MMINLSNFCLFSSECLGCQRANDLPAWVGHEKPQLPMEVIGLSMQQLEEGLGLVLAVPTYLPENKPISWENPSPPPTSDVFGRTGPNDVVEMVSTGGRDSSWRGKMPVSSPYSLEASKVVLLSAMDILRDLPQEPAAALRSSMRIAASWNGWPAKGLTLPVIIEPSPRQVMVGRSTGGRN